MRQTLGYTETLARGYAVVRAGETVVTSTASAKGALEIEFSDGRVEVQAGSAARGKGKTKPPEQGSLF